MGPSVRTQVAQSVLTLDGCTCTCFVSLAQWPQPLTPAEVCMHMCYFFFF